jgi:hypothetical protein
MDLGVNGVPEVEDDAMTQNVQGHKHKTKLMNGFYQNIRNAILCFENA